MRKTHISGKDGRVADILKRDGIDSLSVLTRDHNSYLPEFHPFLNESFGTAMNKAVTFGGVGLRATIIHAGVNSGSAETGTTDGATTAFKLIDSSQNFNTTIGPGALVHNTTDPGFALVTAVDSDTQLTLDTDIMATAEAYVINDIWPGTAVQGTWNFADAGFFTITNANTNDEATFTVDASHIWNMNHFTSFTGQIDLDTYNPTANKISLEFGLDGVLVGNAVFIDDYIDTGEFAQQGFVIPKVDFDLDQQNFNSMRMIITRTAGAKPDIKFDDFQWESSGTSIVYKATTPSGTIFEIDEIRIRITDDLDTTLANASVANFNTDNLLGVATLSNGIVFSRVQKGVTLFSVVLKNLDDFLATGSDLINDPGNATKAGFTLLVKFPRPIVLEGDTDADTDFLSFTINDSLDGLTRFTAAARGAIRI